MNLNVQAFLVFERVAGCDAFDVRVGSCSSGGKFVGKTSLGIVAEGQEIVLALRWVQPRQRFVASSQATGPAPIESFIPFASPGATNDFVPAEFSTEKNFVLNSERNINKEAHENKN